jgi:hypothetical protein
MPRDGLTLAEAQDALFAHISGFVDSGLPTPDSFVVGDARASAAERIAVYTFMYRRRLVEALESQFPRLAKSVGSERFSELAHGYVAEHPSTRPSLRFVGSSFADWLSRRRPAPMLADLAKLEWARVDIFDVRDEVAFGVDAIRAWPQERFADLPIKLIDAHRLLVVGRGTAEHWRRVGAEEPDQNREVSAPGSEAVLVWRQGMAVYHRTVDDAERAVLDLAAGGTSLGRICECGGARGDVEDAVGQSFAWIWGWANDQLLVSP